MSNENAHFAYLSFRPFTKDFRRYLLQALQSMGHPCVHVFLGRGAMEARFGERFDQSTRLATIRDAAQYLTTFFAGNRGIVVNGAGNSAPDIVLRLWMKLRHCTWIYDVYDWFLYDASGLKLLQWWLTVHAYRSIASHCCVLSQDLTRSYPRAFHLQNASHLIPSPHTKTFDNKLVVTAYYDRRTDFRLLQSVAQAAPDLVIDLYGAIYNNDAATTGAIARLTASCKNVRYRGRFELHDLQDILDNYMIGLVPYRAADVMTRFVNPDKLFHYLCAGLEVLTTPVPAARYFVPYVHVVDDTSAVLSAIHRVTALGERQNPGNLHETYNWYRRARELLDAIGLDAHNPPAHLPGRTGVPAPAGPAQ
jgi:hypothetical protein